MKIRQTLRDSITELMRSWNDFKSAIKFILAPIKKSPKPINENGNSGDEYAPNPLALPTAENRPENEKNPKDKFKEHTKWEVFERIFKISEFIGIVAGFCILIIIFKQLKAMQLQTAAMQGQWQAMTNQTAIMQGQLEEMRQTRVLDERAWVTAYDFEPQVAGPADFIRIFYKNTGKTPAIKCDGVGYYAGDLGKIPLEDKRPTQPENSQLLAPDGTGSIDVGMFPKQIFWDVKTNNAPFYLYGTLWYNDVFGKQHWSQFCLKLIGSPDAGAYLKCLSMPFHNSCDDAENSGPN